MIWMGVCTILAIVVGPVIAVCITRKLDRDRAAAERKMEIFRTLMRTRGMPIHWDHVGALNLVEVEFIDHQDVIKTWKEYLAHLNERPPKEQAEFAAFGREKATLLTALIDAIAKALGVKIAQLDILQGTTCPVVGSPMRKSSGVAPRPHRTCSPPVEVPSRSKYVQTTIPARLKVIDHSFCPILVVSSLGRSWGYSTRRWGWSWAQSRAWKVRGSRPLWPSHSSVPATPA